MNYATVEEAKFALLGKLVKMTLEGYQQCVGIVTEVQTFAEYAGYSYGEVDSRPVAIITTQSGSNQGWFANDGDWEIYTV